MTQAAEAVCRWCGDPHLGLRCPWVRALEFETGGELVRRVEFFSPVEIWGKQPSEEELIGQSASAYPRLKPQGGA